MKNQIENLKTKNLDLEKENSELKREIEFISKCKNCSKSTTTERQLFRLVLFSKFNVLSTHSLSL